MELSEPVKKLQFGEHEVNVAKENFTKLFSIERVKACSTKKVDSMCDAA
jgi:hypothetical protein